MGQRVLCILSVIGDTKDAKRIEILQSAGFVVSVAAFERKYYPSRIPNCEIVTLGFVEDGKYLKRILTMLKASIILRNLATKNDLVYALSPDLGILAYYSMFGIKKHFVIDVADIRDIQVSKTIFAKIFRKIEKFVVEKASLLVVTSEAFITNYYKGMLNAKLKDYFVIENKVDYKINRNFAKREFNDKIRLGYFGVLRDKWTLELLIALAVSYNNKFEVVLAGINNIKNIDLNYKDIENLKYLGPYNSPTDLPANYNNVDVIVVFYPEEGSTPEWFEAKRICRSNRFYEGIYFNKPLIAFSFSEDGRNINKYNIGLTIDNYDKKQSIEKINHYLTSENLEVWAQNQRQLPEDIYIFSNEFLLLREKIKKILQNEK